MTNYKDLSYQIVKESTEGKVVIANTLTNDIALAAHVMFKIMMLDFNRISDFILVNAEGNKVMQHGDKIAIDGNFYYSLELV